MWPVLIPTIDDIENPQIAKPKLPVAAYRSIKPTKDQVNIDQLQVMCTNCSQFDSVTDRSIHKVMMKYDPRNEMYRCDICNKAVSNQTIAYTLNLDLPQYIYMDRTDEDKDIETILREREEVEKYTITSIMNEPPNQLNKKKLAKVIK